MFFSKICVEKLRITYKPDWNIHLKPLSLTTFSLRVLHYAFSLSKESKPRFSHAYKNTPTQPIGSTQFPFQHPVKCSLSNALSGKHLEEISATRVYTHTHTRAYPQLSTSRRCRVVLGSVVCTVCCALCALNMSLVKLA